MKNLYAPVFIKPSLYIALPLEGQESVYCTLVRELTAPLLYLPYIRRAVILLDIGLYEAVDITLFLCKEVICHTKLSPP